MMTTSVRIGLVSNYGLGQARCIERGIVRYAQKRPDWILLRHDASEFTIRSLETIRPTGLIAHVISQELADILQSRPQPVVNVGPLLCDDISFPVVGVDNRQVGRLAMTHLRDRGLRDFGFVGHPRHVYSLAREAGFREALDGSADSYDAYYERPTRSYLQRARLLALNQHLQRWLLGLPKPAGIFACHDLFGVQVVEACRLVGLHVPNDVAVVGVDNDEVLCELARPSLSSVILPAERIGAEAAALLEHLLNGSEPPNLPTVIPPCGVVTRQSSDVVAGTDADLTRAMHFIRTHADRPLSVDDVLREVPVSRRILEIKFRGILQRGIAEEIRRVHLDRAKTLLATSTLSVSEVADRAGFSSVYYMCHVFRRETGQTPTAFRKQSHTSKVPLH